MPEECKVYDEDNKIMVVPSYRKYYIMKKKRFNVWSKPATIPEWFTIGCKQQDLLDTELFELYDRFRTRHINVSYRYNYDGCWFFIAYYVANKVIENEKKRIEKENEPRVHNYNI